MIQFKEAIDQLSSSIKNVLMISRSGKKVSIDDYYQLIKQSPKEQVYLTSTVYAKMRFSYPSEEKYIELLEYYNILTYLCMRILFDKSFYWERIFSLQNKLGPYLKKVTQ